MTPPGILALLLALGLALAAPLMPESLTVRVDTSRGAPRILVNGRPVRARMFYGQPGSGRIRVSEQPQQFTFDFSPAVDAPNNGTLHFRFGNLPGRIWLDDIAIVDSETGAETMPAHRFDAGFSGWNIWPPGEQNTVGNVVAESGELNVTITPPQNGVWPDFHLYHDANLPLRKGRRYRVRFRARAEPARELDVALYRPGVTYVHLGGPPGYYESQVKMAADAGVDFVSFTVPLPWPAPGEAEDWSGVDAVCDTTLKANPKALLVPRIPVYVPEWWKKAYPDELMRWENGTRAGVACVASERYLLDASARLESLVRHMESKYGSRVAGYHPCGQNTGEWFYFDSWERGLNGYAPADARGFRKWLRSRYETTDHLRAAWNSPTVDFETAAVPSPESRLASPDGVFRNPETEQSLIDFARFQQDSMAECVMKLASVVRRASHGRKLVLFFYGYVHELGGLPNGPATSGHYALRRVLACPEIDILCGPISYFDRGPGGSAPCMSAAESVALAGKMWLNEDDTRTHLTREENFPGHEHRLDTADQTVELLKRNVAQAAARNFATWWMDLPASGWFNDPKLWRAMKELDRLDAPLLSASLPYRPEVAAVVDERCMPLVTPAGVPASNAAVYESRAALGRMGAPYAQYLLDDAIAGNVPAKMLVFLNAWQMSRAERDALKKAARGRTKVWCYAPGYFDAGRKSLESMRDLTGFALKHVHPEQAWANPTEAGRRLGLTQGFGLRRLDAPLFAAADARPEEILAVYPDGSAALALRRLPEGWSLFAGAPGLTPEVLRIAARKAGVALLTDSDCVVYRNGPYAAIHGVRDGPVTLRAGRPIFNLLTGRRLGAGPSLTLDLKRSETLLLRLAEP